MNLFAGRLRLAETRFGDVRRRWLSHEVGQFMGRDPEEYEDALNMLLAFLANPVRRRDPFGLGTVCVDKSCPDLVILEEEHSVYARCKSGECCAADGVFNILECARAGSKHGYYKVSDFVTITVKCQFVTQPYVSEVHPWLNAGIVNPLCSLVGKTGIQYGCRDVSLKAKFRKGVSDRPENAIPPTYDPTQGYNMGWGGFLPPIKPPAAPQPAAPIVPTGDPEPVGSGSIPPGGSFFGGGGGGGPWMWKG
jgi:hypothetical protein